MTHVAAHYGLSGLRVSGRPLQVTRFGENKSAEAPAPQVKAEPQKKALLLKSLKNLLLFPVPPAIGYLLFDSTGVTEHIADLHESLHQIIGHEGFGHAGLCFGIHYLVQSGKAFWQSMALPFKGQKDAAEKAETAKKPEHP